MSQMHTIDYEIHGDDMQYVEIELDPEEAAVAESGGMMFMADGIEMETVFGDGSASQHEDGGIELLSTHPMSDERAAYLKAEIERAGSWPAQPLDVA